MLNPDADNGHRPMNTLGGVPLPDHLLSRIREQDPELHQVLATAADLERQTETLRRQLGPEHPLTKQTERAVAAACRCIATSALTSAAAKQPPAP